MSSQAEKLTLARACKNQFFYKFKARSNYICVLIVLQILTFFIFVPNWNISSTSEIFSLSVSYYNAMPYLAFTVIWIFLSSMLLHNKPNKDTTFSMPGNRLSDSLSDIALLVSFCLFGGLSTALLGAARRVISYFTMHGSVLAQGFYPKPADLLFIFAFTALYCLLFCAAGYLLGAALTVHPVLIVLLFVVGAVLMRYFPKFYFGETSPALFALKAVVTAALFFTAATAATFRLEVRK